MHCWTQSQAENNLVGRGTSSSSSCTSSARRGVGERVSANNEDYVWPEQCEAVSARFIYFISTSDGDS